MTISDQPNEIDCFYCLSPLPRLHWHSMDVVVLAQNNTAFDPIKSYETFNMINPPRQDLRLL